MPHSLFNLAALLLRHPSAYKFAEHHMQLTLPFPLTLLYESAVFHIDHPPSRKKAHMERNIISMCAFAPDSFFWYGKVRSTGFPHRSS